ncbi:hypothetical protein A6R68_07891 [Neotoma lepida]|uniref:Uncharacterized protein n=1 Tax=Neotoma lepida TaxID=56216 RepID=A0A1A6GBL8_NEOLE|nr:hypothetical protein A6R68_07891 [Neotoma lepida]
MVAHRSPPSWDQMMRFSWQNYRRYAMGKNELRPLTKDGYEGSMFGELTQTPGHRVQLHFGLPLSGLAKLFWTRRTQARYGSAEDAAPEVAVA